MAVARWSEQLETQAGYVRSTFLRHEQRAKRRRQVGTLWACSAELAGAEEFTVKLGRDEQVPLPQFCAPAPPAVRVPGSFLSCSTIGRPASVHNLSGLRQRFIFFFLHSDSVLDFFCSRSIPCHPRAACTTTMATISWQCFSPDEALHGRCLKETSGRLDVDSCPGDLDHGTMA